MIRYSSNKLISRGFKTHRAGRKIKRAGIVTMGAAGVGLAARAVPRYMATRGLLDGLPHEANQVRSAAHRSLKRLPGGAGRLYGRAAKAMRRGTQRWVRGLSDKTVARAARVANWTARHNVGGRAWKLGKVGAGVTLAGLAVSGVGNMMIKHGFGGHKIRDRIRRMGRAIW